MLRRSFLGKRFVGCYQREKPSIEYLLFDDFQKDGHYSPLLLILMAPSGFCRRSALCNHPDRAKHLKFADGLRVV
jgi:hypothetical protein